MAKHSSFKNLVALEACQNFFLIAGISPNSSPDEAWPQNSDALDLSPSPEDSVQTDSPPHNINPIIFHEE